MAAKGAKGILQQAATAKTRRFWETTALGDRILVRVQDPVITDDFSEAGSDISVVRPEPLAYEKGHSDVKDFTLLIEISDSPLKYEHEIKPLAQEKTWVQDHYCGSALQNQMLHVY